MSTFISAAKLELAVYGYIKGFKFHEDIPDVIKNVIIEFAKFIFDWKNGKCVENLYQFNEVDPTRLIKLKGNDFCGTWSVLALCDKFSLDVCKKFEWELKTSKIKSENKSDLSWMFGVVEYPMEESVTNWKGYFGGDSKLRSKQFGVIVNQAYKTLQTRGGHLDDIHDIGSNITDGWKEGDRFGMIIDFEAKEMGVTYNGEYIGIAHRDIPDKIVPAIAVLFSVELICTKYECK